MDERLDQAKLSYERSVFGGDHDHLAGAERQLDGVEADLALARGRLLHARFLQGRGATQLADGESDREIALFERAQQIYHVLGDVRGEAEALFWMGCFHQVVRDDAAVAVPLLERSRELADDPVMLSYALRHLGFAEHAAGRLDSAREFFETSTRLRREAGFLAGVAANLVGLAYLAAEEGDAAKARALLDEAADLAGKVDAHGILRYVDGARRELEV